MTKMSSKNPKISLQDIKQFEQEYDVTLPNQYVDFLLEYNGDILKNLTSKYLMMKEKV